MISWMDAEAKPRDRPVAGNAAPLPRADGHRRAARRVAAVLSTQAGKGTCHAAVGAARRVRSRAPGRTAGVDALCERRRTNCDPTADRTHAVARIYDFGHQWDGDVGGGGRETAAARRHSSVRAR